MKYVDYFVCVDPSTKQVPGSHYHLGTNFPKAVTMNTCWT